MASSSLYHEIRLQYKRNHQGQLLEHTTLHNAEGVDTLWYAFQRSMPHEPQLHLRIMKAGPTFLLHQYEVDFESHVTGLLFMEAEERENRLPTAQQPGTVLDFASRQYPVFKAALDKSKSPAKQLDFRSYFALVLLTQPTSRSHPSCLTQLTFNQSSQYLAKWSADSEYFTTQVRDTFEELLLFRNPEHDQWQTGREMFNTKLRHFINDRSKMLFCLPAFPCKSSNPEKVGSIWPDGAEFEALTNLFTFCIAVRNVYPPGCALEVVSNGHVFSDCIGVDDEMVSAYTKRLHDMTIDLQQQFTNSSGRDCSGLITFQGLQQLLFPMSWTQNFFRQEHARMEDVIHPVNTKRTTQDSLNRGMLLHSCSACHQSVEQVVRTDSGNSLTMLYRGFARFMLDDLQAHPDGQGRSKSQRKKMAEKVALEMMRRNQAYSHLVELVMPRHVRLSIHAHNNAGPKFAISMLPKHKFKPLTSFDGLRLSTQDDQADERQHLHIPTPWHNTLVNIEGDPSTYVCKAGLVKAELKSEQSVWSEKSSYMEDHERGGRFVLYRKEKQIGPVLNLEWPKIESIAI